MASKEDIVTLPTKNLRQQSDEVSFPLNKKIEKLIADMKSATLDWEASRPHEFGVALAATQIGVLQRVVVVRQSFRDKSNTNFDIFINPEITRYEGEVVEEHEGCLSVSDVYGMVPRYSKVKVKAKNEFGRPVKFVVKGFLARVFQHEVDHTNGITFVDKIGAEGRFFKLLPEGQMDEVTGDEKTKLLKYMDVTKNAT
ncbi:TPA: peptide deformylase [Candidatus Saccharibacteria bacterium]|nr:peptide deformylase [Candidatus Saccharibacteria bacterium]HIO87191.1 peptide deformylase [Candidatus Saccharibacteria bacterium]